MPEKELKSALKNTGSAPTDQKKKSVSFSDSESGRIIFDQLPEAVVTKNGKLPEARVQKDNIPTGDAERVTDAMPVRVYAEAVEAKVDYKIPEVEVVIAVKPAEITINNLEAKIGKEILRLAEYVTKTPQRAEPVSEAMNSTINNMAIRINNPKSGERGGR